MQQQCSFNMIFLSPSKESFSDYVLVVSEFCSEFFEGPLSSKGKETDGYGKMRGTGLSVHSVLYG